MTARFTTSPKALLQYPLASQLHAERRLKTLSHLRPAMVSEALADDVLTRLAPFFQTHAPIDIVDLWPNAGLWSSKVNDFLRPRRHVLAEPNWDLYARFLDPLLKSKPCYERGNLDPLHPDDVYGFLSKFHKEQGSSNDSTLLVLANFPMILSKKNHITGSRWLLMLVEYILRGLGLHTPAAVQLVTTLGTSDARSFIPRTVADRKRLGSMTDTIMSHAVEIAAPPDSGDWSASTGWDLMTTNAADVAERAARNNVFTPAGREPRPITMALEVPDTTSGKARPYVPRVKDPNHDRYTEVIKAGELPTASKSENIRRRRTIYKLVTRNRDNFASKHQADMKMTIEELVRRLSRDAANPNMDFKALQPLAAKIEQLGTELTAAASKSPESARMHAMNLVDNRRWAQLHSGSVGNATSVWYRRPFEPLVIKDHEMYTMKNPHSIVYFKVDGDATLMQKLRHFDPSMKEDLYRTLDCISLGMGSNLFLSLEAVFRVLFPTRSSNDVVRTIPTLARYAFKRLKPDFDSLPKTLHPGSGHLASDKPLDPVECFQENLDYDFSDVRIRSIPGAVLCDICLEYVKVTKKINPPALVRELGGTLTMRKSGNRFSRA